MSAPKGRIYRVSAAAREGFLDRRRIGEAWPRGGGNFREVFVVDDTKDPPGRKLEDGTFAIGQESFAVLKKDPEIFINGIDASTESDETAKWRQRAMDSARRVVQLEALAKNDPEKAALEEQVEELEKANAALTKQVADLEDQLEKATAPAVQPPAPKPGDGKPAAPTGEAPKA